MYASQTKRLCVRGAPSDETRVQHHSTTQASESVQQSSSTPLLASGSPSQLSEYPQHSATSNSQHPLPGGTIAPVIGGANETAIRTTSHSHLINMTASAANNTDAEGAASPIKTSNPPASTPFDNHGVSLRQPSIVDNGHDTNVSEDNNGKVNESCNSLDYAEHELIQRLASETMEATKLDLLLSIRNLITACNKKKDSLVSDPHFSKILSLLDDENSTSVEVKTQLALLLCSVAKASEHNVKVLSESSVDYKIYNIILTSQDDLLVEACLRCLRSIMSWSRVSRTWILYENQPSHAAGNPLKRQQHQHKESNDVATKDTNLKKIIAYAMLGKSFVVQECIADIFAATCARNRDQVVLCNSEALPCIVHLLESPSDRVVVASLNWLTAMCLRNPLVSLEAIKTVCPSGVNLLDQLTKFMSKDEYCEFQFLAARCFAQIYRSLTPDHLKQDPRIVTTILPTLVRMVHKDKPPHLRSKAAECIANLIDREPKLQETASDCDHLIESLANMLEYEQNAFLFDVKKCSQSTDYKSFREREVVWTSTSTGQRYQLTPLFDHNKPSQTKDSSKQVDHSSEINPELCQELRRSAFLALGALASSLEPIRKRIFNTCSIMQHLVRSLADGDTRTLKSVLTCLLSLSRSVQQLRTSFSENTVYSALKSLLTTSSNDVLILVLAILCNISLDFSPGKQHFLDSSTINILCNLTRGSDSFLRLHGMWILMNMVYQLQDQNLKIQILRTLGMEHVLNIIETENDEELVMKSLGFLRNLLSQKSHIDIIMCDYGEQIMQSLIRVLERPCSNRIKEQTLCVLTNIADGTDSKALIMGNRIVLAYLAQTICDEQAGDMRLAAICCITNLAHKEQDGSYERRNEMKQYGIEEKLKSMLNTNDPILSDRARTAYNQFLIGIDDKFRVM